MLLRQRLNQLLTCIEDMSSDDEANEEVSRSLDEAFQLCGSFIPPDSFRLTHAHSHRYTHTHSEQVRVKDLKWQKQTHFVKVTVFWN